jgi:mono/diheme cytochrome c family protein
MVEVASMTHRSIIVACSIAALAAACSSAPTPQGAPAVAPPDASAQAEAAAEGGADVRGGRAYDQWRADGSAKPFRPDDPKTEGVADGEGGPFGDGTLSTKKGPLLNTGHDYRLKNLHGWDLRGKAGIYGPKYMNKPYVLARDWLSSEESEAEIATLLCEGDDEQPALCAVLERPAVDAIAAFIVRVRDGKLPRPEQIFELSEGTPGNYRLVAGADPARGRQLYADRCVGCHGTNGTAILFDEGEYTLGSHARQKAYEDWLKILNGHPGSAMGRQARGPDAAAMASEIRDLLAALCDRQAFPVGEASKPDVPDGDPRCGGYLR